MSNDECPLSDDERLLSNDECLSSNDERHLLIDESRNFGAKTAKTAKKPCFSVHLPKMRSCPAPAYHTLLRACCLRAPKVWNPACLGQHLGLIANQNVKALNGRDIMGAAPSGLGRFFEQTQGPALGWHVQGRWPSRLASSKVQGLPNSITVVAVREARNLALLRFSESCPYVSSQSLAKLFHDMLSKLFLTYVR